jgi:hypothetical protein
MKKYIKYFLLICLGVMIFNINASGQYSNKKVRPKHQSYTDSIKNHDYNYIFPIFGQKTYRKGFDIPYPAGIMINYMWIKQSIVIDNMQLGIKTDEKDIALTPVDFIGFGDNTNTSYTVNVRPDLWIFPFLNVYGIFGYGKSNTEVNLVAPIALKSVVEQGITTYGFGVMGAFGIGPVWMSVDANFTWNKPDLLEKSVPVNVLGVRVGHTFTFKKRPDRNFAIWIGAMRVSMGAETLGEIKLADALSPETWDRRDEIVQEYHEWYDNLSLLKQKSVDETAVPEIIDRLDNADGSSIIRYGMDKQVKEMWNGLVGAQFQLNKHWMIRSEVGLIGDRKSFLCSVNYRFLM